MDIVVLLGTAVALAMDAFAVSVCKGLAIGKIKWSSAAVIGAWFGVFQAGMPLIGYFLGSRFSKSIEAYDHWIAFGLLTIIGASMIFEALSKNAEKPETASLSFKTMFLLAVATSIDALAVGVSFSLIGGINIFISAAVIGVITFALSFFGSKAGGAIGGKFKKRAELAGGVILIALAVKILIEHLS